MEEADAVVIGGGCTGTSIAYNLKRFGVEKIILLEKSFIGSGATAKSAGIVRQHYSTEFMVRIATRSLNIIRDFQREVGADSGYKQVGLVVATGEDGIDALKQTVAMQQALGVDTKLVSPSELKQIQPGLRTDDLAGAAHEPGAGYADPSSTTRGYAMAAEALGVRILQKTEVVGVELEGRRIKSVQTNLGSEIATPVVVNATNAWANRVNKMVGIELPIRSVRSQVCLLRRPPDFRNCHVVLFDFVGLVYMKPEGDEQTLAGTLDPQVDLRAPVDPDMCPDSVDYEHTEMLSEKLVNRFPLMGRALARGGWSGPYDVTPDWHPILDQIEEVGGYYCAVGFSGHGFKICPAVGEMMANLIVHGRKATSDINNFRSTRFEEGKPIVPKYSSGLVG